MKAIQKYMPFAASALLMYVLLYSIYPHYQYYVDPDGTAYLTIAQRYADGIFVQAINGYWSPWSCWLTALLIKAGLQPIPASVIINTIGATGFLYISQSFFLKFRVERALQWVLNLSLVVFLCFAVFWQSFDDLWECFFLLSALRMMLVQRFAKQPGLWLALGLMGALAYFAKAYAFPFFILNTVCCVYFITHKDKGQWLKICAVAIVTMVAASMPWIYALNYKYGIWTTSTAGSLNMSWYLVGHPYWREGVKLLPPAYPDSPYYWEDPYVSNGITPHFWSSWHLFGLQFLRIGLNGYKLLISMLQLSVFFPVVAVVALLSLWRKKLSDLFSGNARVIALSFVLFPLGYVLINFESRYLWYMLPLSMVLGSLLLKNARRVKLMYSLIVLSLVVYPLWELSEMYDTGKNEYTIAQDLNRLNIHGAFTTHCPSPPYTQAIARVAYFSGNAYYNIPDNSIPNEELLKEIKKNNIPYYYQCFRGDNFMSMKDSLTPVIHTNGVWIYEVR